LSSASFFTSNNNELYCICQSPDKFDLKALGLDCTNQMEINKLTNKFISFVGSIIIFILYFIMKTVSIKLMECLKYKTTTMRMLETRTIVTNISMFQLILLIIMPKYENDRIYSYANAKAISSAVLITYTLSPIAEVAVEIVV
jgi:hypothetical protein